MSRAGESARRGADPRVAGELAAALFHDVRNMLAVADTSAHLAATSLDDKPYAARQLSRVREQIRRVHDLAERCLAVAKGEPVERAATTFGAVWDEAWSSIAPRANVTVTVSAATRATPIACDVVLFARALANLVDNAQQAIEAAGTIVVDAALDAAGGVVVRVCDDGPGIDAALLFTGMTTKPGGSGLGLLVVRAIVSAHSGSIELEPASCGTIFRIALPG